MEKIARSLIKGSLGKVIDSITWQDLDYDFKTSALREGMAGRHTLNGKAYYILVGFLPKIKPYYKGRKLPVSESKRYKELLKTMLYMNYYSTPREVAEFMVGKSLTESEDVDQVTKDLERSTYRGIEVNTFLVLDKFERYSKKELISIEETSHDKLMRLWVNYKVRDSFAKLSRAAVVIKVSRTDILLHSKLTSTMMYTYTSPDIFEAIDKHNESSVMTLSQYKKFKIYMACRKEGKGVLASALSVTKASTERILFSKVEKRLRENM